MGTCCYAFVYTAALNLLSIDVTVAAIVPGAYTGEAKTCKKCAKMANFWTYGLNYWETVEDRWVHAAIFDKHWILFSSVWHLLQLFQGRTQGRPKCALGWLKKLTHVQLAIAILLVKWNREKWLEQTEINSIQYWFQQSGLLVITKYWTINSVVISVKNCHD